MSPTGKILIVSAESGVLGGTGRILKQAGCEIISAATGQECLAIALSRFPDLVLLDTVLPDVDCVEVCRKIKADPALAGLFVILMSANQTAPDQLCHGLESGADGYFTHPIADRELIGRVQALLRMRQKQEALRQSEKRYRDLLNEMPDGYAHCRMVFDHKECPVDLYYLDVNEAFEKMTGLKNVVGRPISEVLPNIHELNPEIFEIYGRVVLTGKPHKFEIYFKPLGRWLAVSVTKSGEGCFAAIFQDISARKKWEEALRDALNKSEKQAAELEAIMDAVPAAIFLARDVECREISGNRVAQQLLGLPALSNFSKSAPPEQRPSNFHISKAGKELPVDQLPVQMAARGQEVRGCEVDLIFDDGKNRTILGDAVPLRNTDGQAFGAVGAFVDVTEHKQAEEELRHTRWRLENVIEGTHVGTC